jgi:hypothetical protein
MHAEDCERQHIKLQRLLCRLRWKAGRMEWADLLAGMVAVPGVGVFRLKEHDLHVQGMLLKANMCFNGKQTALGGWQAEPPPAGGRPLSEGCVHYANSDGLCRSVAADLGLKMKQIDVKSAFTQVALPHGEEIMFTASNTR